MTTIRCSFFRGARDNQPSAWSGNWAELLRCLNRTYSPRHGLSGDEAKKSLRAIAGATFSPGSTRARAHVHALNLLILDFDNTVSLASPGGERHSSGSPVMVKVRTPDAATVDEVAAHLEGRGQASFLWSTWSATPEWPRLRAVVPLASPCAPQVWEAFTEYAMEVLDLNRWRPCIDLPALRDTARMNFLPGAPDTTSIQRREVHGRPLMVPSAGLETVEVPASPIPNWQQERTAERKREGHAWAKRFRSSDGSPLDLRTLDAIRLLEHLGCEVGPPRAGNGSTKHRTTCPWWTEHTHGENDDSAVLFLEPGRWPAWHCSHSHHAHLGLVDLLELAGVINAS